MAWDFDAAIELRLMYQEVKQAKEAKEEVDRQVEEAERKAKSKNA